MRVQLGSPCVEIMDLGMAQVVYHYFPGVCADSLEAEKLDSAGLERAWKPPFLTFLVAVGIISRSGLAILSQQPTCVARPRIDTLAA